VITIERDAILEAMDRARIHLHHADRAAELCLQADHDAEVSKKPWAQDLFTQESEDAGRMITDEQNKAISAITQLITEATNQDITITERTL